MIILDYNDRRPLYEQIVDKISNLILKGILKPGDKMPSVRNLAMELAINPNTIQRAYGELEHRGYIYSVKGRGNFVSHSESLIQKKQEETCWRLQDVISEAKTYGIREEKIAKIVKTIYEGGEKDD